ncbi:MAG: phosphoribosylformylglycinamidine synthase subunit PurL, partial [Alphaproteobacteria bacterium]|nr:phosphoribosylformylglycinamidine synthase subunit PurL [Alphaproteobacteria bacterium]
MSHSPSLSLSPDALQQLALEFGVSLQEYTALVRHLKQAHHAERRDSALPTPTEVAIVSAMWSEHCSYKSSRCYLSTLPTEGPDVICGPGENAGVVAFDEDTAIVFKMESHNHPSFIMPYQGAATGVGGILRDVFTMGARPVALVDALRLGSPAHRYSIRVARGVVAGIAGYGNSIGIPTVGGESEFDAAYNANPLVNAMAIGVAPKAGIFYSKATGVGNIVVYIGAKTGRQGIHGASMASAVFEQEVPPSTTVQIGNPFLGKKLMESTLALMKVGALVSAQDMGAAGLTSSSVEMAAKGGLGIDIDLDTVPCSSPHMLPYEIMLSESQERMLMVLSPEHLAEAEAIFAHWELDMVPIGRLTDTRRLVVRQHGTVHVNLDLDVLTDAAPAYRRPTLRQEPKRAYRRTGFRPGELQHSAQHSVQHPAPRSAAVSDAQPWFAALMAMRCMLTQPSGGDKSAIWQQYDWLIGSRTQLGPNQAASAVFSAPDADGKGAVATTATGNPRYCCADPLLGGKLIVAEAYRHLCAVGATPSSVTNNLNFGDVQNPVVMAEVKGCLQGMAEACLTLGMPVVSGNVSFYNATRLESPKVASHAAESIRSGFVTLEEWIDRDGVVSIPPTPVIGAIGIVPADPSLTRTVGYHRAQAGEIAYLVGGDGTWLGCSALLSCIRDLGKFIELTATATTPDERAVLLRDSEFMPRLRSYAGGGEQHIRSDIAQQGFAPPPIDLDEEYRIGHWIRTQIQQGVIANCNDIGKGGLLQSLVRVLLASDVGCILDATLGGASLEWWFGEDQGRYVITVDPRDVEALEKNCPVPLLRLGMMGGDTLAVGASSGNGLTCPPYNAIQVDEMRAWTDIA